MTTRLAVIPARGGSTRLAHKNIHPLGGKPLIQWTVEAVCGSGCFDRVLVSTDSPAIAEAARKAGKVEIHERPERYAGSRVTVLEALLALMEETPRHDVFAYFLPTCPFRSAEDIRGGVSLLVPEVDAVVSVCEYSEPPQLALLRSGDEVLPVFDNLRIGATNSRYITHYVKPSGGFYMAWWDRLLEQRNFFAGRTRGWLTPRERAVDIDDLLDIHYAEAVLRSASATSSGGKA